MQRRDWFEDTQTFLVVAHLILSLDLIEVLDATSRCLFALHFKELNLALVCSLADLD